MSWARAGLALIAVAVVGLIAVSGGEETDPRTPRALPGLPVPFLGTAVVGSGGLTAAVDAYGNVVDLRAPGPAGQALIDNPADRQAAGSVPADTGIVPRVSIDGGPALPLWRADAVAQRYLPGTNVVRTVGRFGDVRVELRDAARGEALGRTLRVRAPRGVSATVSQGIAVDGGARCEEEATAGGLAMVCAEAMRTGGRGAHAGVAEEAVAIQRAAAAADRRWLAASRPLGAAAPAWASRLHERSLLALRALTDERTGASAAGARDGWAYVWPRDAGAAALALAAAGYEAEARQVAQFLLTIAAGAAARFHGDASPVPGRAAQGDATGWIAVAAAAAGLAGPPAAAAWRDRADYWEGGPGEYLANAIASAPAGGVSELSHQMMGKSSETPFGTRRGLVREAGEPGSGLDSAAAWAVRPFEVRALYPQARETLRRLAAQRTRFGITPGEGWKGGDDPWGAPTAWTAWGLAALAAEAGDPRSAAADRRAALAMLAALRRSATPAGALPERVDVDSGIPRSTTPLAWPHAFAILALRELWPAE